MNVIVRKALTIAALLLCITAFVAICGARSRDRMQDTCSDVRVSFKESYRFVDEDEVKHILERNFGSYVGQRLDSMRLDMVEAALNSQSAIQASEAYVTDDGYLNLVIIQRKPVLRLQMGETGFYADESGFIFPLQPGYPYMVPVVDGDISLNIDADYKGMAPEEKGREWMASLIGMLRYMEDSKVWAENISQIHVDEKDGLMLYPREGREVFIFGYPTDIAAKFGRVENYYKYIKPEKDENYYRTVNVQFEKQIICKK